MGEKMRDIYDLTDEELVKLFQEGNEWCFNEIYNRYSGKLLGYATKHIRSKEDAEEITNTTFALTFKYLNKFRGESSLSTWLYCILRNQICNHFRIIQRRGDFITQSLELTNYCEDSPFSIVVIDWNLPENHIIQRENMERIIMAIDGLPDIMMAAARLYIIDKLPIKVIAQLLNCPGGTIRSRTHRIRKYLRDFPEEDE